MTNRNQFSQLADTLAEVSTGRISAMEAASRLNLPDAGYVFRLLAEHMIDLPRLPDEVVQRQLELARSGLDACLRVQQSCPGFCATP